MNTIETALSTALFDQYTPENKAVVVVDVLRATSVICTMFHNGAQRVIPVASLDEARRYKAQGYTIVAERNGQKVDFADFGNSPRYFTPEVVSGKTLVYSTTNGTQAIGMSGGAKQVLVGAFLNHSALCKHLLSLQTDVLILCAGWKGKFCLEDTMFAGSLAQTLMVSGQFDTTCDSTYGAIDIWNTAKPNIPAFLEHAAQRHRLKKLGLDDVIEYCCTFDVTTKIPVLSGNALVAL